MDNRSINPYDLRMLNSYLKENKITKEEYDAHIKSLDDLSDNIEELLIFKYQKIFNQMKMRLKMSFEYKIVKFEDLNQPKSHDLDIYENEKKIPMKN